jgi:hypothetical protein
LVVAVGGSDEYVGEAVVVDLVLDNFSMYEAVDGCFCSRARSAGVCLSLSLAFGSAPALMRALMISSDAPF